MTNRAGGFASFVTSRLPGPSARVLEVGCGSGDLARDLAQAGHDVTAIDPDAPDGPIFRQVRLEDFDEARTFDAVVASRSLHHIEDLPAALDRIVELLGPGGRLLVDEFAWDRLDDSTAHWYFERLRALADAGRSTAPATFEACRSDWTEKHGELHISTTMLAELTARFAERHFSWEPYLYRYPEGSASEAQESELIRAGAIQATGFRYVGEPLPGPA